VRSCDRSSPVLPEPFPSSMGVEMRDLPIGTVTFVFTDVEGSTRLLEGLGGRYRDVQQRHNAMVRAAIGEGGAAR
jgi:class 3 adenylate cyclase